MLKTTIIERIAEWSRPASIPDISDVQDHSDRNGMRIVIELKKGAEPEVVINQLYKYTPLQATFSIINIALVNGSPRTLTLREMHGVLPGAPQGSHPPADAVPAPPRTQRAHILEGLILAVCDIDQIIKLIKQLFRRADEAIEKLHEARLPRGGQSATVRQKAAQEHPGETGQRRVPHPRAGRGDLAACSSSN